MRPRGEDRGAPATCRYLAFSHTPSTTAGCRSPAVVDGAGGAPALLVGGGYPTTVLDLRTAQRAGARALLCLMPEAEVRALGVPLAALRAQCDHRDLPVALIPVPISAAADDPASLPEPQRAAPRARREAGEARELGGDAGEALALQWEAESDGASEAESHEWVEGGGGEWATELDGGDESGPRAAEAVRVVLQLADRAAELAEDPRGAAGGESTAGPPRVWIFDHGTGAAEVLCLMPAATFGAL